MSPSPFQHTPRRAFLHELLFDFHNDRLLHAPFEEGTFESTGTVVAATSEEDEFKQHGRFLSKFVDHVIHNTQGQRHRLDDTLVRNVRVAVREAHAELAFILVRPQPVDHERGIGAFLDVGDEEVLGH